MKHQNDIVHVAVGVIKNQEQKYLITKRPHTSHQGGLWEFPGGKLEPGESVQEALKREIFEEVGIDINRCIPLIRINHDYGDKIVLLDVWQIEEYHGHATGKEKQELRWIDLSEFTQYSFPSANLPIIKAIDLPDKYMITGDFANADELSGKILKALNAGIKLIQFRAHNLHKNEYFHCAKKIYTLCRDYNSKLFLNTSSIDYLEHKAYEFSYGLHLTTTELMSFDLDMFDAEFSISASVHNERELKKAEQCNLDFVVLSPVKNTRSHPNSVPIGWNMFKQLTEIATMPVYALGGMTHEDIRTARLYGGQGVRDRKSVV